MNKSVKSQRTQTIEKLYHYPVFLFSLSMHHRRNQRSSRMDRLSHRCFPGGNWLERQTSLHFLLLNTHSPALMHDGVKQNPSFSTTDGFSFRSLPYRTPKTITTISRRPTRTPRIADRQNHLALVVVMFISSCTIISFEIVVNVFYRIFLLLLSR